MKTAIVYDRVNKWGGAERVLLALHNIFPDAPLYTSLYSPAKARWAEVFPEVIPSFLNKLSFLQDKHQYLAALMPQAFESFNFDSYDLVISVTSEAAKGIITKPNTKHICYLLTPTRYLWSGYNNYFENQAIRLLSKPIISYLRSWDKIAAQRPDVLVAISSEVKNRIQRYYERDSKIIFPTVDVDRFKKIRKYKKDNDRQQKYFLIVSRLEPYKKVDLAIKAFNQLKEKLVVIGIGNEEHYLRSIAEENIIFKGFVDDNELPGYYQNAKAFIFPQEEDFGITAVEAQAAGCPVIAYKKGGSLDTVINGVTGIFFNTQGTEYLVDAIKRFEKLSFNKRLLINNADKFNERRFNKEILDLVEKTV